jgi:hypothetical protein
MLPRNLIQENGVNLCMQPATDAAGRTGTYISLKTGQKVTFVFEITQGNAATVACSVVQATTAGGAGSKAIAGAVFKIWTCLDVATSDVFASQTDAASFTTDAALKNKLVVIEVDASQLDIAGGFAYVAPVTGASNVANLTACLSVVLGSTYQQAAIPSRVV